MASAWRPATRLTALRAAQLVGVAENPALRCGCGRTTTADMLSDVRTLPAAVRATIPHAGDYACDGCMTRLTRDAGISRADLARHLGAPDDVVAHIRARTTPQASSP